LTHTVDDTDFVNRITNYRLLVNYIELYVYAIVHSIFNCRLLTVDRSAATFVYN